MSRQLRKRARSSSRGPPSIETTDSLKMKKINSNNKKARKMRKKRLPIQATNTNNDDTKMQEEETLNDVDDPIYVYTCTKQGQPDEL